MKQRDYEAFVVDVYRFRPIIVMVMAILIVSPSCYEMVIQGLSVLTVLLRLAGALAFAGVLVWLASGMVIRYARIQTKSHTETDPKG